MNAITPVTGRFISAVRRRLMLARLAESVAIAIAVASSAGLLLTPILWWRGQSATEVAAGLIAIGILCGLFWGISCRPTRLEAALEADRQLDLHDLLSTFVLMDRYNPSPWTQSLLAYAENRCATLHPSAVIVNRIGLRGWAGVGVLGSLLLAVTLLTTHPTSLTAATSPLALNGSDSSPSPNNTIAFAAPAQRPPGPGGADDDRRFGNTQRQADAIPNADGSQQDSHSHSGLGTNSAGGSGSAVTHPKPMNSVKQALDATNDLHAAGNAADGSGQSNASGLTADNHSKFAASRTHTQIPPWSSPRWPTDSTAAENAIQAGSVPPDDADLVRDYFRRD